MSRVYLSPSLQEHNVGVGAYGTEMDRMRQVAEAARQRLIHYGVEVRLPAKAWAYLDPGASLYKVVKDSNAWRADLHICAHTDASGDKTRGGTMTMYYPGSVKGERIATLIQKHVAPLSPGADRGLVTSPVFYETREARAPVAYLEMAFHTSYADANSVIQRHEAYGVAIADACLEYLGITAKPLPIPTPAPVARRPRTWGIWRLVRLFKKHR